MSRYSMDRRQFRLHWSAQSSHLRSHVPQDTCVVRVVSTPQCWSMSLDWCWFRNESQHRLMMLFENSDKASSEVLTLL
ncbi:MAG: hypothetical protein ACD_23C01377G0001 [uncultured bacterium]|nr:MAG: hypothetical protein ACD_23C01377G0001 [uncultured bacterium]